MHIRVTRMGCLKALSISLLCLSSTSARADDWVDCRQAAPTQRIAACTKVIEQQTTDTPRKGIAYNNRGWGYNDNGEYDKAVADLSQALRISPKNTVALVNRAYAHFRRTDFGLARSDLDTTLQLAPAYAAAYALRGRVSEALRKYKDAIADHNEAIGIDPNYLNAYANRGNVHALMGATDLAMADYRKVLSLTALTPRDRQQQETAKARLDRHEKTRGVSVQNQTVPRRVALVIGNAAYANVAPLANPRNDAVGVANMLRRIGFADVTELYDQGHAGMIQAIKAFGDKAMEADWAVVFFAGHGIEINGTSYLIPIDAKLSRDDHVADEAVSLDRIQAKVDGATKLGLVILDACRNNPFAARMTRATGSTRSASLGRGLGPVEPEGNVLVAYAAKHGTIAEDGTGRHSPFTEALLQRADEANLEVGLLFRKVRDDVRLKTQRRQEPFVYGSLGSELLYMKATSAVR